MKPSPVSPSPSESSETWLSVGAPILVMVAIVALVIAGLYYKRQRWSAFAKEHDCQVVGNMAGDVAPTVGFSPHGTPEVGFAIESDKVGWKCNDGVTYWR